MAGRKTYLHPEAHNDGGYVQPVVLSKEVIIQIGNIIGRDLSAEEIASISRTLAHIRTIRTGFKEATNQDIKRTLASFSKLPPSDAAVQFKKSDTTTQALIDEALGCDLGFAGADLLSPTGESIKQAAKIAFQNLTPGRAGQPIKYYRKVLAEYALFLWDKKFSMEPCKPWHNDADAAPIVQFMNVLASIVDGKSIDFSDAVTLLKKAKKREGCSL